MLSMNLRNFQCRMLIAIVGFLITSPAPAWAGEGVTIQKLDGKVRIEIGGELFGEYIYQDVSRPYLYPLCGPGGAKMTRDWPMAERDGEERDHPHHKSFWYAHGAVNGTDFWSETQNAGRTEQVEILEITSGPEVGVLRTSNKLVAKDGTIVCTDERTLRVYNHTDDRMFDFEITIHASHGPITFGDTKEGTMAMRLAETMRLKPNQYHEGEPTGHIVNSEGVRDGETWGKRAAWVDYYGPVDGRILGVAIFDHPQNPRHPTWWHVRDYGLFAANPFGVHDFEHRPEGAGELRVPAGGSLTFRYRFYVHRGDEKDGKVARHYQEYAASGNRN